MAGAAITTRMTVSNLTAGVNSSGEGVVSGEQDTFYEVDITARLTYFLVQPSQIVCFLLGFAAISLNILSILAIFHSRHKLTAHYRFIVSLALSDLFIGVTITAHFINYIVNPRLPIRYGSWNIRLQSQCIYMVIKAMNTTALNITLLNLMAMAIDHFLAIIKPLHYPTLMSEHRASFMIIFFWCVAFAAGCSDMMTVYPLYTQYLGKYNYCELVLENPYQEEYPLFGIALLCCILMTVTYVRMFITVRRRHHGLRERPLPTDSQHSKKALYTTLLILGTFILCWLPQCLFQLILIIQVQIDRGSLQKFLKVLIKADQYLYDLLLLNAILDPVIYAIRMREVQVGYRRLFARCCRVYGLRERARHTETTRSMFVSEASRTSPASAPFTDVSQGLLAKKHHNSGKNQQTTKF